ncbi:hypothetical protein [Polyangium spumosum]|uniref:EGF-like domain-containing protein n=1 Tax=Polyangium spumosum TaxID=889282 RepID=A0A6N7PMN0_9BACT|nr:hypothetical protein [Polyangium spumosum]MRG93268.1 hypothetical protein [Polyangium spumosum]
MTRSILSGMLGLISVLALGGLPVACQSGGVGDPCIPEDEYKTDFAGFKVTEENIESRSFQCQTRICLVNHFQGRVSCPYGQTKPTTGGTATGGCQTSTSGPDDANKACCVPGTDTVVEAEVCGQCAEDSQRDAAQAVYCSCRCGVAEGADPDPNFNFCECPTGYTCEEIRPDVGLGDKQLTGKYCIKQDTKFVTEGSCGTVKGHYNATQCKGVGFTTDS